MNVRSLIVRSVTAIAFALCFVMCAFAQSSDLFDLRDSAVENQTIDESSTQISLDEESYIVDGLLEDEIGDEQEDMSKLSDITGSEIDTSDGSMVSSLDSVGESLETGENDDEMISINFENVDIRDVIRILADKGQVNMIVGPGVQATVNIQLKNVTWQTALDVILMTYNLTYKKDDDLIRIMTLNQMIQEDEKIPLSTEIIRLDFARAGTIQGNFKNMLSPRGRIDVNQRTNSLIVTDLPDFIEKVRVVALRLDTRTPQVMIEALIADVKVDTDDKFGIEWDLVWPDRVSDGTHPGQYSRQMQQTLGGLSGVGGLFSFGTTMLTNKDLGAVISAYQKQDRVNVLAHPKILTLDNLAAKIDLTEEIPYQKQTTTTDNPTGIVSTSFKSAGISLSVTPHITTKDNFIFLDADISQSFQSGTTSDGSPIIDSRAAKTSFLVRNKETAVIGGLRKKNDTFSVTKVPVLGDIPFFGGLFRKRSEDVTDTDLMIFVTPTIIEDFKLTAKEEDRLGLFNEETKDWLGRFDRIKNEKKKTSKKDKKQEIQERKTIIEIEQKDQQNFYDNIYLRPPFLEDKK